jgi:hypothetical protein
MFYEEYSSPPEPSAEAKLLLEINKSLKEILAILKESQNAVKNNIEK